MNFKRLSKGFTLIELLVVIGILAVLAAGVVALIDPVEKTNQAKDTKVKNDISQIVTAFQSYAAQQPDGSYPTTANWNTTALTNTGELTVFPAAPTGSAYSMTGGGLAVTNVCGTLLSKRSKVDAGTVAAPAATAVFKWESNTGKVCVRPACGTACP